MVHLDHINLSVENLETSLDWYAKVFGFEKVESGTHNGTPYAIVRCNNSMLSMYQIPGKSKPESSETHKIYHFGLRVENKQEWETRLAKLKIKPNVISDYKHSKSWYLSDPTGHEIEVSAWINNQIQF